MLLDGLAGVKGFNSKLLLLLFFSWEVIQNLTTFLIERIQKLKIKSVQVDFHGGEPMLQKRSDFDEMCHYLRKHLGSLTQLTFE